MSAVQFVVEGAPIGKGRPRASSRSGMVRLYTPAKTVGYEQAIAIAFRQAAPGYVPLLGPVSLRVNAWFAYPPSWPKKRRPLRHVSKPDGDNILKALCDALNGLAWKDDAQVAEVFMAKHYGSASRLVVEFSEMQP